jgi:hypothetical protein
MVEWLEDHMAGIGSLKLEPWNHGGIGLTGDRAGPLGEKRRPLVVKVEECDVESRHI